MSNRYFYFTRHGQTIWNVENKICGATDIALTDLGHQQAIDLGSKIAQEDLGIDEILYSPLMRAADTAKHISQMTGIPARMEPRLKEQNFGKYESTPRNGDVFRKDITEAMPQAATPALPASPQSPSRPAVPAP